MYILCWLHNLIWFYDFNKLFLAKGCLQKCQSGHSFKGGLFQKPNDPGNRHGSSITSQNVKKLKNKLLTLKNVSLRTTSLADLTASPKTENTSRDILKFLDLFSSLRTSVLMTSAAASNLLRSVRMASLRLQDKSGLIPPLRTCW